MCFACSPVALPPIWLMMMSTGFPGISRGRYQLATIASSSTPRYHATLPRTYRRNVCTGPSTLLSSAPRHHRRPGPWRGGTSPHTTIIGPPWCPGSLGSALQPDLVEPLDAGARRGGRCRGVRGVREAGPLGVVVLEELQGSVLQRDRRDVLPPEVVQLREQRRLVGRARAGHLVQQRRHARVGEPVVVPERGLAGGRDAARVQDVVEAGPGRRRVGAGGAVHGDVEVAVL